MSRTRCNDGDDQPITLPPFKVGDTFEITYGVVLEIGGLIGSVDCTISDGRNFSLALTVTPLGEFETDYRWRISATKEQTATWPETTLQADIKRTFIDSKVSITRTFYMPCGGRVTP